MSEPTNPTTDTTSPTTPISPPAPTRPTQRYKLTIAYRGTRYHGWQAQGAMDTYKGEPPPPDGPSGRVIFGLLVLALTSLVVLTRWLGRFQRPVRLVWGIRDKHFTLELGRRLAAAFPLAQLDEVADATTFVSIDRPGAVVSAVEGVLATSRT